MEMNKAPSGLQFPQRQLELKINPLRTPSPINDNEFNLIREITPAVKKAVIERDNFTCCYCGFQSKKYQQAVLEGGNPRNIDSIYTACIFCHQCFDLESAAQMRSGALIWLPEISQAELSHIAIDIYRARITAGDTGVRARAILNQLLSTDSNQPEYSLSRRLVAHQKLGTDEPGKLANKLRTLKGGELTNLRNILQSVRLFPLDRRIIRDSDIEFNQFPQILAYWRSKYGPFPQRNYFPWLNNIENALGLSDTEQRSSNQHTTDSPPKKPHKELASKLLNDAATFFRDLASQNPNIEKQMLENSEVFEKIALLVAENPDGQLASNHGSENPTNSTLAGRLLKDAAKFFVTLGNQNPNIKEQMHENANVYNQMGILIETDPHGELA